MAESYDKNYWRIASLGDLPLNRPALFRAAGSTIVMLRSDGGVEAVDGSCTAEGRETSAGHRLKTVMDCVAGGLGVQPGEWSDYVRRGGLPVRVEEGSVWVCIDGCRK